jgi:hypothetical protein
MIVSIDINEVSRDDISVFLEEEDVLFWILPGVNDGSPEWVRAAEWLAIPGNVIQDRLWNPNAHRNMRRDVYPDIGDQLDDLFHAGAFSEEMGAKLQAVKDQYPKVTK